MKTQIIELEPGDDLISVRDKMEWANGGRILLVWPDRKSSINRKMDLTLLQRKSTEVGAQLGIVCKDPEVHWQCKQLGIPCFHTLKDSQVQHWRVINKHQNRLEKMRLLRGDPIRTERRKQLANQLFNVEKPLNGSQRIAIFSVGIFSMLAIAAILLPSAQVIVQPIIQQQAVVLEFFTDEMINEISLQGGVPSEMISVEVEGQDVVEVSGSVYLPYQAAAGEVVFSNLGDEAVEIPKGTVVRPSGDGDHRYTTLHANLVPAGIGQSVHASVESLSPGTKGNLPANSINAIEGYLGTLLSASNPQAIVGGTDRVEPIASQDDRQRLSQQLDDVMMQEARSQIMKSLSPDDLFLENTLIISQVEEEQYFPEGEYPTDTLSLKWRKRYEARIVRHSKIQEAAITILDANKAQDYDPVTESLSIEILEEPHLENDRTVWAVRLNRRLQASSNSSKIIKEMVGISRSKALERLLLEKSFESTPQIQLQPSWWPMMPILPFRIDIMIIPDSSIDTSGQTIS